MSKIDSNFSSNKNVDKKFTSIPFPKESGSRKNIGKLNNSQDNSPGKLMNNFKMESKSSELPAHDKTRFRSDFAMTKLMKMDHMSKTLDFQDKSNPTEY